VKAAFYTVSDARYFIGTVALLNSIRLAGHQEPIFISDCGLDEKQRKLLEPVATIVDASSVGAPHHAKLCAAIVHTADLSILIDSDVVLVRRLDELTARASRGAVTGFADPYEHRFDPRWGPLLGLGELTPRTYVNAGLLLIPRTLSGRLFPEVERAQAQIELSETRFGRGNPEAPFYYVDQDVWNALFASNVLDGNVDVLPSRLAPHPPFKGLRARGNEYVFDDGLAPFVLHHVLAKPWLEQTRQNLYSQLLPRLLLAPGLPIRLDEDDVPLRLRPGATGAAARAYADAVSTTRLLRGRLGIRPRLSVWLRRRVRTSIGGKRGRD
jgi:hypothetical protein